MSFDILLPLSFVFGGAILFSVSVATLVWSLQSKSWPIVMGQIISSRVVPGGARYYRTTYSPIVRYTYHVGEKMFTSSFISLVSKPYLNECDAIRVTDRYHKGESIVVHYNPRIPGLAVLETKFSVKQAIRLGAVGAASLTWMIIIIYSFVHW